MRLDYSNWGSGYLSEIRDKTTGQPKYWRARIPVRTPQGATIYKDDGTTYQAVEATHKTNPEIATARARAKLYKIYLDHGIKNYEDYLNAHPIQVRGKKVKDNKRTWTVEKYANYWRANFLTDERHTPSVQGRYRRNFKNHLIPVIGNERISEITSEMITTVKKRLEEKQLKPSTQIIVMSQIKTMFKTAVEEHEILSKNPVLPRHIPKARHSKPDFKGKLASARVKNHTRWMLRKVKEEQDDRSYLILLLMLNGLRQAERNGLCWDKIKGLNRKNHCYIQITRQYLKEDGAGLILVNRTKTDRSNRQFYVGETLRQTLLAYKTQQDQWKQSIRWKASDNQADFVLTTENGRPYSPDMDNEAWTELRSKYITDDMLNEWGLETFTTHLMRHLTASFLADQKTDVHTAAKVMGHSNLEMFEYYAETDREQTKTAMLQHNELLGMRDSEAISAIKKLK